MARFKLRFTAPSWVLLFTILSGCRLGESAAQPLIAFCSDRDGNREIYVMRLDGSHVRRLTNDPSPDEMPRWSPDGNQIAFRTERDGNQEIYTISADGSELRRLTNTSAKESEPSFSPDGSRIVFASKLEMAFARDLWLLRSMAPDGTERLSLGALQGSNPRSSPDGRTIMFTSLVDGDAEIFLSTVPYKDERRLTHSEGYDGSATFSPNGDKIAFVSMRDGNLEVYVAKRDGTGAENVTKSPANDGGPVFLDEDNLVLFSDRDNDVELYRLNLRSGVIVRLTSSVGYDGMPDIWVPADWGGDADMTLSEQTWFNVLVLLMFLYLGSPLSYPYVRTIPILGDLIGVFYLLHPVHWFKKDAQPKAVPPTDAPP